MTRERASDFAGWVAIGLIQGATLPSLIGVLMGWSKTLPPLSMVMLLWAGLALFMWRSIERKDTVAIVSNAIGWLCQSVILSLYVLM